MTAATSAPPGQYVSRVRRLPLPVTDPPFDDELGIALPHGDRRAPDGPPAAGTPIQGTLPLDLEPDAFEDRLRPIGGPAVADSLWLRYPGPESSAPSPGASSGPPPARATASAPAPGPPAARGPAGFSATMPADVPAPAPATSASAAAPAHTATPAAGSPRASEPRASEPGRPAGAQTPSGSSPSAAGAPTTPVSPSRRSAAAPVTVDPTAGAAGRSGPAGPTGSADPTGTVGAEADGRTATAARQRRHRPSADELPDPRRWTARLAQSALECLHGRRPVQQLVRWTAEPVYRELNRQAVAQDDAPTVRPRIRSLRVCRVSASVAEASVVVQLGPVVRAVAVRLEADDGRWLCTAFEVVDPGPPRRPKRGAGRGDRRDAQGRQAIRAQRPAQASSNASA
ncbi:Rv3235 family protein [Jiangella endophytica]|uniref:Rv3235 family protein n=1 Tax=Jiangella endophytica TaxID=1623398 RepID=UPI00130060C8|nr:Rv3235 family protein [Jiangella endophytica]